MRMVFFFLKFFKKISFELPTDRKIYPAAKTALTREQRSLRFSDAQPGPGATARAGAPGVRSPRDDRSMRGAKTRQVSKNPQRRRPASARPRQRAPYDCGGRK